MEPNVNTEVSTKKPSLFGIITSPAVQFERMKTNSPVWGAFVIVVILSTLAALASMYAVLQTPEMIRVLAQDPTGIAKTSMFVGALIGGLISTPIRFFITAGFYKIIMMLMGNDATYKQLLSITVYASIISILGVALNAVLTFALGGDGTVLYTSLGSLFDQGTTMFGIANAIEIFSIWGLVITGLGLHIVAGLSKKKTIILMVVFFALSVGIISMFSMFSSSFVM